MHIVIEKLGHANIDPVDEQGTYILRDDYRFALRINGCLFVFDINKGFSYDGASVPSWARWLIERDGVHRESALVHDWLYENRGHVNALGEPFSYVRKDADQIFRECLKAQGLASWKVWLMCKAVRIGGRFYWND